MDGNGALGGWSQTGFRPPPPPPPLLYEDRVTVKPVWGLFEGPHPARVRPQPTIRLRRSKRPFTPRAKVRAVTKRFIGVYCVKMFAGEKVTPGLLTNQGDVASKNLSK